MTYFTYFTYSISAPVFNQFATVNTYFSALGTAVSIGDQVLKNGGKFFTCICLHIQPRISYGWPLDSTGWPSNPVGWPKDPSDWPPAGYQTFLASLPTLLPCLQTLLTSHQTFLAGPQTPPANLHSHLADPIKPWPAHSPLRLDL